MGNNKKTNISSNLKIDLYFELLGHVVIFQLIKQKSFQPGHEHYGLASKSKTRFVPNQDIRSLIMSQCEVKQQF